MVLNNRNVSYVPLIQPSPPGAPHAIHPKLQNGGIKQNIAIQDLTYCKAPHSSGLGLIAPCQE